MRTLSKRLVVLAAACLAVLPLACGGPVAEHRPKTGATLEGTVHYHNQKVPAALVIVQGDKSSATGMVDADGHYKVENAPVGEVHVAVNTAAGKGMLMSQVMSQSQGKAKSAPKVVDLPPQYFQPATSGLKTTVNQGPNTYDIVINK